MNEPQKTSELSRILDSQPIKTNPFGRNSSGEKAYRRVERLVAAVHLITRHIPEPEPARIRARVISIELLSSILALRDEMRVTGSSMFLSAQALVRELISLLRTLSVSGYISHQNVFILGDALDEVGIFLVSSQRSALSESVTFTKDELIGEGVIKDMSILRDNKDTGYIKDVRKTESKDPTNKDERNARSLKIADILKSQGQLGIKDISANLPEYSEKMIQRELASMVATGRIKKLGSKRWSTYLLVQ